MKRGYVHQTSGGAFVPHLQEVTRAAIARCFPALPIDQIESAAQSFFLERELQRREPEPAQIRKSLAKLDAGIVRLLSTFGQLREQRLDSVLRQDAGDPDVFDDAEESLQRLRRSAQRTSSRVQPASAKILANRMLVQRLSLVARQAGLGLGDGTNDALPTLVGMIFSDEGFKDTADPRSVVREWKKSAENGG